MPPNLWSLYAMMLKSRLFEEAVAQLWHAGLISGEIMVDFLGLCMDALLNHAAKVEVFSGGKWNAPLVVRAPCGGGYGDGGQHGLSVDVTSTPADAGGLILAALQHEGPVIFLEHKLLSESWLEFLGSGGRQTVRFDLPPEGRQGPVPRRWEALPLGKAAMRREGNDVTIAGVGVSVHRALEAAQALEKEGIPAGMLDLKTVSPPGPGGGLPSGCQHGASLGR